MKRKVVLLFADSFNINTSILLEKNDFQIIGEGSSTKFLLRGGETLPSITITGKKVGNFTPQPPI